MRQASFAVEAAERQGEVKVQLVRFVVLGLVAAAYAERNLAESNARSAGFPPLRRVPTAVWMEVAMQLPQIEQSWQVKRGFDSAVPCIAVASSMGLALAAAFAEQPKLDERYQRSAADAAPTTVVDGDTAVAASYPEDNPQHHDH